jgi:hypothetical protein
MSGLSKGVFLFSFIVFFYFSQVGDSLVGFKVEQLGCLLLKFDIIEKKSGMEIPLMCTLESRKEAVRNYRLNQLHYS